MKILVTGAAGFIGSNLCESLVEKKHQVIGIDNFITGKMENLSNIINSKNFEFIEGDITDYNTCLENTKNINVVIHQAALGSVPRSIKTPLDTNQNNVNGFLNMIESSRLNNIDKFIYASSSSVYGDSESLPKIESVIGKPLSPYAVTKSINELYAGVYFKTYGLKTIGLRYFNVFGKHQDPDGQYAAVIPKFIKLFLEGNSPTINGDGSYSRDFTYIKNVVKMNLLALETNDDRVFGGIFNTATGQRHTIKEMTEFIKSELSNYKKSISEIPISYSSNRMGDIPHSHANIDKAKSLLNYHPDFSFKQGIIDCLEWYINNL